MYLKTVTWCPTTNARVKHTIRVSIEPAARKSISERYHDHMCEPRSKLTKNGLHLLRGQPLYPRYLFGLVLLRDNSDEPAASAPAPPEEPAEEDAS